MRYMLQAISAIALAATILPSGLFLAGTLKLEYGKWIMLAATLAWFAVTPLWMNRARQTNPEQGVSDE